MSATIQCSISPLVRIADTAYRFGSDGDEFAAVVRRHRDGWQSLSESARNAVYGSYYAGLAEYLAMCLRGYRFSASACVRAERLRTLFSSPSDSPLWADEDYEWEAEWTQLRPILRAASHDDSLPGGCPTCGGSGGGPECFRCPTCRSRG